MDNWYWFGYSFGVFLGTAKIFALVIERGSLKARNMRQVNYHFHGMTGKYEEGAETSLRVCWFFCWLVLITPFFSWLTVASWVASFLHGVEIKASLPEEIKKMRFNLSTYPFRDTDVRRMLLEPGRVLRQEMEAIPDDCFAKTGNQ